MVRGYSAWQRRHGLELSSANLNAINKLLFPPTPLLQVKELQRDRGERLLGGGKGGNCALILCNGNAQYAVQYSMELVALVTAPDADTITVTAHGHAQS